MRCNATCTPRRGHRRRGRWSVTVLVRTRRHLPTWRPRLRPGDPDTGVVAGPTGSASALQDISACERSFDRSCLARPSVWACSAVPAWVAQAARRPTVRTTGTTIRFPTTTRRHPTTTTCIPGSGTEGTWSTSSTGIGTPIGVNDGCGSTTSPASSVGIGCITTITATFPRVRTVQSRRVAASTQIDRLGETDPTESMVRTGRFLFLRTDRTDRTGRGLVRSIHQRVQRAQGKWIASRRPAWLRPSSTARPAGRQSGCDLRSDKRPRASSHRHSAERGRIGAHRAGPTFPGAPRRTDRLLAHVDADPSKS